METETEDNIRAERRAGSVPDHRCETRDNKGLSSGICRHLERFALLRNGRLLLAVGGWAMSSISLPDEPWPAPAAGIETSWELRAQYHPAQWLCQFENYTEWNGSCERPRVVDATQAVPWRCRRETCFRDRTGPRSALFSPPLVQVATVAREDSRSCELSKDRSLDIVRR